MSSKPSGVVKVHLRCKRLRFATVTRVSEVRQSECNRSDVLAVEIYFRRRVDARICNFKSQKRGQRFRFNRKLEHGVLLTLCINSNCLGGESSGHGSEVLDVDRKSTRLN